ncbi:PIN domain-containing protein [Cryptosporangium sp. NPDC051539]|uniref:PIN domain-containing protein n=1 Tax=Cryptosporangium sp. NPDC051539 TaxID=3363962 RepID=UPI0037A2CC13
MGGLVDFDDHPPAEVLRQGGEDAGQIQVAQAGLAEEAAVGGDLVGRRLGAARRRHVQVQVFEVQVDVLPFDAAAAATYADIVFDRDRADQPIDGFDAQIAAICRSRQATLATRNTKDFHQTGVELVDPWLTNQ